MESDSEGGRRRRDGGVEKAGDREGGIERERQEGC